MAAAREISDSSRKGEIRRQVLHLLGYTVWSCDLELIKHSLYGLGSSPGKWGEDHQLLTLANGEHQIRSDR